MAQNLSFIRGDTNVFFATVTLAGAPLDLSTYDIWCTAKYSKDDVDIAALFQVTRTAGDITIGGSGNNVATVTIGHSLTSALVADTTVYYDIQIEEQTTHQISTVVDGQITITRDITQAS